MGNPTNAIVQPMQDYVLNPPWRRLAVFSLPALLLLLLLVYNLSAVPSSQQFSELARAFLHGRLYFLRPIGGVGQDPVVYNGHQYWGDGPFPALVLLPFVAVFSAFRVFFYQQYIDWLLVSGTLYLVYALARKLNYGHRDSLFWMFGFTLGSAFIGVAFVASSWLLAQVITVFLLFWSLNEYFGKRRWWLIGSLCACVFLTRATAAAIVIFYGLELAQGTGRQPGLKRFGPLVLPLALAVSVQGLYNYWRFHSPLNDGLAYQLVNPQLAAARRLGAFSLRHIPTNLYALVFGPPGTTPRTPASYTLGFPFIRSNHSGTSIFITSPYILWLFGRKWAAFPSVARHLLVACAVSCLGVLCFYGIGGRQIGYRYSLDFLPELFTALMLVYRAEHKAMTRGMKFLLLASCVFDFYLVATDVFLQ